MSQSNQQPHERKFIAVTFRGVQEASRERTALTIAGTAAVEVTATLADALPQPDEVEPDAQPRAPLRAAAEVALTLGGEGARAAYTYAALNGLVSFAGTVPGGAAGDLVLRWLSDKGVDLQHAQRREASGTRVLLSPRGYQGVLVGQDEPAGADDALPELSGGTLLLAGYPFAGSLRGPRAVELLQQARARRMRTVVSLCPVEIGGPGRALSPEDLEALLPHVDLVCGGPAELRRATRRPQAQDAARALLQSGARAVLAKRGPAGAAIFTEGPAALERGDTTTPSTATALAADIAPIRLAAAFGAAFDAAYLLGEALNDASPVRFAAAAATRVAQSANGVLGL
jgi:sugar/nucleoside kinase (ribokinase family)